MRRLILTLAVLTAACSGGSGGGSTTTSKDFFSVWTAVDNSLQFDFTGGTFFTPYSGYNIYFTDGAVCSCTIEAQGAQSSGAIAVTSCSYAGGGMGDPGCVGLENGGTAYPYSKTGSTLIMCLDVGVGCLDYK